MTDQEQALLAEVIARPDDDLPRLILADWWEENAGKAACPRCRGDGWLLIFPEHDAPAARCPICHGTGRVPDGRAERAEFVRVQVELAKRKWCESPSVGAGCPGRPSRVACGKCESCALRRRERELRTQILRREIVNLDLSPGWSWDCGRFGVALTAGYSEPERPIYKLFPPGGNAEIANVEFRRGFVEDITCTAADWLRHREAIKAVTPLRKLVVSDRASFPSVPPDRQYLQLAIQMEPMLIRDILVTDIVRHSSMQIWTLDIRKWQNADGSVVDKLCDGDVEVVAGGPRVQGGNVVYEHTNYPQRGRATP